MVMNTMRRIDIINHLIEKHNFQSYLEIGVRIKPNCAYTRINCKNKTGVDPVPQRGDQNIITKTSDDFFDSISLDCKYDLIFIDGLHLENQVDKDIQNSLRHLNSGGLIVLHDCSPLTAWAARENYGPSYDSWNGTVYKSIVKLRCRNKDMSIITVDDDHGCGIIDPSKTQELFSLVPESSILNDFSVFDKYRKEVLNLITFEQFKNL